MKASRLTTAILILAALWSTAAMAEPLAISFAQNVAVTGQRVSLLDLVRDGQDLDEPLRQKLAAVHVATAPVLGQEREISGSILRTLLKQADLPVGVTALLPVKVEIRRASQTLTTQQLSEAYRQAAIERLGSRGVDADIHSISAGADLTLPAGQLDLRVNFVGGQIIGRAPAMVEVMVDGHKIKQTRVVGTVDVYGPVVVAARSLAARQVLGPEDVELMRVNLASIPKNVVSEPERVIGMRTRGSVGLGQPLDMSWLEPAPLIHRGEIVTLIVKAPGLNITTRGRAEETGYMGKAIKLTNLTTKRTVNGRVASSGEVIVDF